MIVITICTEVYRIFNYIISLHLLLAKIIRKRMKIMIQKPMKKISKRFLVYIIHRIKIIHTEFVVLFSVPGEFSKMINNRIDGMMNSLLASVNKKLDFVTKKINQVYQSSSFVSFRFLSMYKAVRSLF